MPFQNFPISVQYCRFCGECHHNSETGFFSNDFDQWFCNTTCYYQARLSRGDLQMKNRGISQVLLDMRKENGIYCPKTIKNRKERFQEHVRNGRYKVIRKTHAREDVPIQE